MRKQTYIYLTEVVQEFTNYSQIDVEAMSSNLVTMEIKARGYVPYVFYFMKGTYVF